MTQNEIAEYFKDAVFPQNLEHRDGNIDIKGLTKREYFAAMAMQGILANNPSNVFKVVKDAVETADILIAELNK
jgi:hypothetical protein